MFQEVARRTGRERMREWLDRLEYGNRDITGGIDLFWLQGALRVSASEQVDFLRKLSEGRAADDAALAAPGARGAAWSRRPRRTRSTPRPAPSGQPDRTPIAWWVGWIERKGRPTAYFAMNFAPTPKTASRTASTSRAPSCAKKACWAPPTPAKEV